MSPPVAASGEHRAGIDSENVATVRGNTVSADAEKNHAIVFRGGGGGGANAVLNGHLRVKIGSPRDGELVLVWLLVGSATATLSPPSGYTQVGPTWSFNVGNTAAGLFYHFWRTGDATLLTFAVNNASAHCDWTYAYYSGVNRSTPFDGKPTQAANNLSTTGSSPSIIPGAGNKADMLLMLYGQVTAGGGKASSASLGTIREQYSYEHVPVWVDAALSSSAATGAQTVRSNVRGNWIGIQALLLPQSPGHP